MIVGNIPYIDSVVLKEPITRQIGGKMTAEENQFVWLGPINRPGADHSSTALRPNVYLCCEVKPVSLQL